MSCTACNKPQYLSLIKDLKRLANELDFNGMHKSANTVGDAMKKLAQAVAAPNPEQQPQLHPALATPQSSTILAGLNTALASSQCIPGKPNTFPPSFLQLLLSAGVNYVNSNNPQGTLGQAAKYTVSDLQNMTPDCLIITLANWIKRGSDREAATRAKYVTDILAQTQRDASVDANSKGVLMNYLCASLTSTTPVGKLISEITKLSGYDLNGQICSQLAATPAGNAAQAPTSATTAPPTIQTSVLPASSAPTISFLNQ